jgi:hypothetical protein
MPAETLIPKKLLGAFAPVPAKKTSAAGADESEGGRPSATADKNQDSVQDCETELLAYRRWMESRDDLMCKAKAAGLTEVRIAQLTGHSRNTVRAALGNKST